MSRSVICIGCRYEAPHAHSSDLTAAAAGDACAQGFVPLSSLAARTVESIQIGSPVSNPDSQVSYAAKFACSFTHSVFR